MTSGPPGVPGRVIYAGFATDHHSGGVQVLCRHVEILRRLGIAASLWLPGPDGAPDWFPAGLPLIIGPTTPIDANDLLVLPEVPVAPGHDPAPGARKVLFNQNHFYTFAAEGFEHGRYPDWDPLPRVWAVSRESEAVLSHAHPGLSVDRVPPPIDIDLFAPSERMTPTVSWFPRKRPHEASLLLRLLRHDRRFDGVVVHELVDRTHAEVASALALTTVFVALGHSEGLGLPVVEALSAGCLVVGYDGGGGDELFDAPGSWRIPAQRPLLLRDAIADLLINRAELEHLGQANRAWATKRFSVDVTTDALLVALGRALATPGRAAIAEHPALRLHTLSPDFAKTG